MSKRKPLEPVQVQQNNNFQVANEPIKQRSRSKSSGISFSKMDLNDDEYSAYWNEYEMSKNLEKALNETNGMNLQIEEEISKLSNVEDELRDQIALNQQLYDLYMQYRDQGS